jgi:4Fe-4S ferredoxin
LAAARGEIFAERCRGCGECIKICPQNAIEVNSKIRVASNECIFCGRCEQNCPTCAIKVDPKERKVEINGSLCLFCGSCEHICPKGIIKMRCLSCLLSAGDKNRAQRISNLQVEGVVKINGELCIYCGRCELKCPTNAIKVIKPFEGRISVNADRCQENCEICIDFCPCDAIKKEKGKLTINESICIYCGTCYRICPHKAIGFERKSIDVIDVNGRPIICV